MLDLAPELIAVLRTGEPVAVVSIRNVPRSAPRGVGASMAVTAGGRVIGSISGGCVEGDAVLLAHTVLADGEGRVARFGFTDETAHAAGLACGGSIDVVVYRVEPSDDIAMAALQRAAQDRSARIGVECTGPRIGRLLGESELQTLAPADDLRNSMLAAAYTDETDVLMLAAGPRARLIIAGAGDHASALCRVASAAGFAVTVCDPWPLLVTTERFPDADRLVADLPHRHLSGLDTDEFDERTAICVLTHDERIDIPTLRLALRLPVGFVGAMGSRATVARRAALLRQAGTDDDALARLHSPLGLDLQGSTPEETAIAIVAEILAARHRGTGLPLRDLHGPVHREAPSASCSIDPSPLPEIRR